jgi:photosystem II stability/assembly factor-like uncharacterized protein
MKKLIWCLFFLPLLGYGQAYELTPLTGGTNTSLRGMSIVSDHVAWVSGSNGSIGKTIDGGATWQWIMPAGYETLDFRDIEAFDADRAVVVNAGAPAFILLTKDGGKTWTEHYKNVDSAIFLDGMDFWDDQTGMTFGDPIKNKMQLLRTRDGGVSWSDVSDNLKANIAPGEASFAASGSTIKTMGKGKVWIATGGAVSNIYFSNNYGYTWKVFKCPILQGESSTGPFSIAFLDKNRGVVVGGNYLKDKENTNNVLLTNDGGQSWKKPLKPVSGFRSGVTYVNSKVLLATGTSGTDVSKDGGLNWHNISSSSFNVVQKAKKGKLILLAGNKGEIYKLTIGAK